MRNWHARVALSAIALVVVFGVPGDVCSSDANDAATESDDNPFGDRHAIDRLTLIDDGPKDADPNPLENLGDLPWNKKPAVSLPLRSRPADPRQLLVNIEQSEFDAFFDGQPLDPHHPTLIKILYRLPRFGQANIEHLTRPIELQSLYDKPADGRIQFVRLSGRVKRVVQEDVLPEVAEIFEFGHYFQVHLQPEQLATPLWICTREIPAAWRSKLGASLDERASAFGLFLQIGEATDGKGPLVFAAQRVAWYPDAVNEELAINDAFVYLANLGIDVGQFDGVKERNGKTLGAEDYEAFYQTLAACQRIGAPDISAANVRQFDLGALLTEPKRQHGQVMTVFASARRINKVMVESQDIQERFGLDHYFQIDGFVDLGDQTIRFGRESGDETGPVYTNKFPITICVRELPDDLRRIHEASIADPTMGETLNERVRIVGIFFKLWAYKSEFVSSFDEKQRQLSPMFIAYAPQLRQSDMSWNPYVGVAVGAGFLVVLAGIWLGVMLMGRSDKKFEHEVRSHRREIQEGESLDKLNIEIADGPDFSGLGKPDQQHEATDKPAGNA